MSGDDMPEDSRDDLSPQEAEIRSEQPDDADEYHQRRLDRQQRRLARRPGRPFDRQSPFVIGFLGAFGVFVAYAIASTVRDIGGTLVLVFLALFLAVGLEPIVSALSSRKVPRSLSVVIVVLSAVGIVAAFVYSAISPITHEINQLSTQVPIWLDDINQGKGTIGQLAKSLHLTSYVPSLSSSGFTSAIASSALGAGKVVLNVVSSTIVVIVLTIYFLAALPSIKRFLVRLIPNTRRPRASAMMDQVLSRVGGFLLGNLFTSLVAGAGTFIWAEIFGIPYPILLSLIVALFDLIPVVGSTIAGIIVSLVALAVSLPVAIGTAVFYIVYRFLEDYLLVPRVMSHAVDVSPVVTVLATLIGAAVLGIIGALVAIPIAAAIKLILEESAFPRLDRS